jgi:hypothetical protein
VSDRSDRIPPAADRRPESYSSAGSDAIDLVRREVVEHHDVAGRERRREELFDIGVEGGAVPCGCGDPAPTRRAVEHQRGDDAGLPEPGDERCGSLD